MLTVDASSNGSLSIIIYDVLGQEVFHAELPTPRTQLNIQSLPKGMYFVTVKSEEMQQRMKFVKN
jgi:hypothetical protein